MYNIIILLLLASKVNCSVGAINHPKFNRYGGNLSDRHYFVELIDGDSATNEFIKYLHDHHIHDIDIRRTISHKFLNAVSIEVKDVNKEYAVLKSILDHNINVESISPIQLIYRAEFDESFQSHTGNNTSNLFTAEQVDLVSPHRLSQVDRVHSELNLTGEGLFIGVIDSGVDYYHPALGGGFGKGFKMAAGYDLVGDKWNAMDPNSKLEPDSDPLDNCGKNSSADGHGTHVSGIIAGFDPTNNFTGVAPGAKLGMWRIFSCNPQSTRDDLVTHAMLMAYDAGVNIISASLGISSPWSAPHYFLSKVLSRISASGVSVIYAAGNSGDVGAFTAGYPGNGVSAFSVAAFNNEYIQIGGNFTASGIPEPIVFNVATNSTNLTMTDNKLALSYNGVNEPTANACSPDSVSSSVKGKIALVKRGACTFVDKVANIAAAGATGVIIYDNINEEPFYPVVPNPAIPFVSISLKDGTALLKALKRNPGNVSIKFAKPKNGNGLFFIKNQYAATVATFSSVGPTAELNFKPNIGAVGTVVYSTLPRYLGSWGIMQGTFMACPYVSGSIALYLQYHGANTTSRSTVHEKFQNYAYLGNVDNSTSGRLDNPLRQGAGLVQVYDTILQTSHATPAQLSCNDTFTTDYKIQNLTITNNGLDNISYRISNNVSVSISPYNQSTSGYAFLKPASNTLDYADITFSINEVHLKSGQSQTIQVSVQPPETNPLDHIMYGGFIQFDPINQQSDVAKALHVPYFGIVGSQRDLPIFDENFNMTVQNDITNITYGIHDIIIYDLTSPTFISFSKAKKKTISLIINFNIISATQVMKCEVIEEKSGDVLGYAFPTETYWNPNQTSIEWEGNYLKNMPYNPITSMGSPISQDWYTPVKSGNYSIRISALKQFGDLDNLDD